MADHLSQLEYIPTDEKIPIKENFLDEFVLALTKFPWYADFANFLVSGVLPKDLNFHQRKKFLHDVKNYFWKEPLLYKHYADDMIRRCIIEKEIRDILFHCHNLETESYFSTSKTVAKIWQSGFYWPTMYRDVRKYVKNCDACQRIGNISRKNEIPLTTFLEIELFDMWGIDFIGSFYSSFNNKYILVA